MYEKLDFLNAYLSEKMHDGEIGKYCFNRMIYNVAYEIRFEIKDMQGYIYSCFIAHEDIENNPKKIIEQFENEILPRVNNKLCSLFFKDISAK